MLRLAVAAMDCSTAKTGRGFYQSAQKKKTISIKERKEQ
jgi:hypothetical protein